MESTQPTIQERAKAALEEQQEEARKYEAKERVDWFNSDYARLRQGMESVLGISRLDDPAGGVPGEFSSDTLTTDPEGDLEYPAPRYTQDGLLFGVDRSSWVSLMLIRTCPKCTTGEAEDRIFNLAQLAVTLAEAPSLCLSCEQQRMIEIHGAEPPKPPRSPFRLHWQEVGGYTYAARFVEGWLMSDRSQDDGAGLVYIPDAVSRWGDR